MHWNMAIGRSLQKTCKYNTVQLLTQYSPLFGFYGSTESTRCWNMAIGKSLQKTCKVATTEVIQHGTITYPVQQGRSQVPSPRAGYNSWWCPQIAADPCPPPPRGLLRSGLRSEKINKFISMDKQRWKERLHTEKEFRILSVSLKSAPSTSSSTCNMEPRFEHLHLFKGNEIIYLLRVFIMMNQEIPTSVLLAIFCVSPFLQPMVIICCHILLFPLYIRIWQYTLHLFDLCLWTAALQSCIILFQ